MRYDVTDVYNVVNLANEFRKQNPWTSIYWWVAFPSVINMLKYWKLKVICYASLHYITMKLSDSCCETSQVREKRPSHLVSNTTRHRPLRDLFWQRTLPEESVALYRCHRCFLQEEAPWCPCDFYSAIRAAGGLCTRSGVRWPAGLSSQNVSHRLNHHRGSAFSVAVRPSSPLHCVWFTSENCHL